MVRVSAEAFRLACPAFADVFIGSEAPQGLQATAVIVGVDEVAEVSGQLGMAVVVVALYRCFLDRPVHPLDLAIGPWMLDLGQPVFDLMLVADTVEDVMEGVFVVRHVGELDAIVGQHGVDGIRHSCDQVPQELGSDHFTCLAMEFDEGELAGAVDGYEQPQLALGGLHLGDVDVEVADRVGLELTLGLLLAGHLRQSADAVPQEAAVQ